jgi:hypothetical protein
MNFEAVGPERLVLVARDPWIAALCVTGARVCHSIFFALKRFRVLRKKPTLTRGRWRVETNPIFSWRAVAAIRN